jgi:hypothetical protein
MTTKREEKALLEFKHVIDDIVQLLRKCTEADTVYMYWVNRSREQFVLETSSTILPNVMFQDRIAFDAHFLNDHKNIDQVIQLKVDDDVKAEKLQHYHDLVPARFLTLVPFINNDETVAITVIETEYQINVKDYEDVLSAYKNALLNVLNTYLELTDLYENQQEWTDYEKSLNLISSKMHKVDVMNVLVEEIQKLLPNGGVTIAARGMESWISVVRSLNSPDSPSLGLMVEEKSLAYDALQKGITQFSIHFNQNPKRLGPSELETEGATLAIPMLINDRRHAVILVYDKNPLIFKESTKHKIQNLVRIASLAIQVNLGKIPIEQDLFTSEYGSFIPDLWEKTLKVEIERSEVTKQKVWFGFITVDNVASLRSKYRLESLKQLQKQLVNKLSPVRLGFNGLIGFNSDYIYSFLLIGDNEDVYKEWEGAVYKIFTNAVELVDGQEVTAKIKIGAVKVSSPALQVHEVITEAKKELSKAVKEDIKSVSNF